VKAVQLIICDVNFRVFYYRGLEITVIKMILKLHYDHYTDTELLRSRVRLLFLLLQTSPSDAVSCISCDVHFVRRGSPLVIGVKSRAKFATDHFPVVYSKGIRRP